VLVAAVDLEVGPARCKALEHLAHTEEDGVAKRRAENTAVRNAKSARKKEPRKNQNSST
jgi:hypothetical protein